MSPIMNLNNDGGPIVSHSDHQAPIVEEDEEPTAEDIQQAMRVETYILGLLQRYCINQTPTSPTPDCWQELNAYHSDYCEQPENSEWQQWEMFNNEKESQDRLYLEHEANRFAQACKDPAFSIEPSNVIADIDSHYRHPSLVSLPLTSDSPKPDWESTSLDMAHQLPIARMYQEDNWSQKHLKTISQAQSEGNFRSQGFNTKLEQEYPSQGWEMDMHCFNEDYMSNQRLWSSAADLGREEKAMFFRVEERPPRDANLPLQINPRLCPEYTEHDQRVANDMTARRTQGDGSDSSLSETCSPGSSSRSSDTDESGGLVWPQEVPPGVPSFSQNAPTAMVRIKASHALKRKILRFRSGSLKVMTTV
ncbi:dapper 3-like [Clarias magur]|uniref:Dapper 3-like n=1 Tax=Clarias magur TaxID=1594786 RepID=A0A8J4X9P5_CLAMG|nr:dapper 3-like [Clarias magur]